MLYLQKFHNKFQMIGYYLLLLTSNNLLPLICCESVVKILWDSNKVFIYLFFYR